MGDRRRAICQYCGRHRNEVGELSWLGYCRECGPKLSVSTNEQLHYKRGPKFKAWRRGMILSVGGLLPADLDTTRERT